MFANLNDWTGDRALLSIGTNAGSDTLPYQSWRHFKEAFAPELIARAVSESGIEIRRCLDPFGGSGTTALACQFLGIHPVTAEVNPYLADLIEAKLTSYDADRLVRDVAVVLRRAACSEPSKLNPNLPSTFVEPGTGERWLFNRDVADRIMAIQATIDRLGDPKHQRLLRVILGGVLVDLSNAVVNGKGRRYRRGWQSRPRSASDVDQAFGEAAFQAISEINRFTPRAHARFDLIRGDSRALLKTLEPVELAVFSPPYPNSFDYTDIYNIELWMLGYLKDSSCNQRLRGATLSSHVQLQRTYAPSPQGSPLLELLIEKLNMARSTLWDRRIPDMVGAYFADMLTVLADVRRALVAGGSAWVVVGDSRYADIQVETGQILGELAGNTGLRVDHHEPFRKMRSSAQQGGRRELAETLLIFKHV